MMVAAQERDLIFRNILNNVPIETVAETFHLSKAEVMREVEFVLRKIRSYCFERSMPYVTLDTLAEAKRNRLVVLHVLDRLNLAIDPKFRKIGHAPIEEAVRG